MSAYQSQKLAELEQSNKYLEDELVATKRALLQKESQIEELMSKKAQLEGMLRGRSSTVNARAQEIYSYLSLMLESYLGDEESYELELSWNSLFAFVGAAITHESAIKAVVQKSNEMVLKAQAQAQDERKLRSEAAAQLSSLNDAVDSLTFENTCIKRDRDEAVARSQRQAARITDMEAEVERLNKQEDAKSWEKAYWEEKRAHEDEVKRVVTRIADLKKYIEKNL